MPSPDSIMDLLKLSSSPSLTVDAFHTGAFPCIVNVWPSSNAGAESHAASCKGNSEGSSPATLNPDSKVCTQSEIPYDDRCDDVSSTRSLFLDSERSVTAHPPTEGELSSSCHVSLKQSSAVRKPTGGLSAALKARPSQEAPSAEARVQLSAVGTHAGSQAASDAQGRRPAAQGSDVGCGPQRTAILSAAEPADSPIRCIRSGTATRNANTTAAASGSGLFCKPTPGAVAADATDDGGDGCSTLRATPSEAAWDWLPGFSPSLVDRLWTGRASTGGSSPRSRSSRLIPPGLPVREGSSARKRSQHGKQSLSQQQQQPRRRQDKEGSGQLRFLAELDVPAVSSDAGRAGPAEFSAAGGGFGAQVPAPHVPCMALVAAAAAAAPAPRALGAACSSCCSCGLNGAVGVRDTAARVAKADSSGASEPVHAGPPLDPTRPPPPPAVAATAALGHSLDMEIGMPTLGGSKLDRGCSGGDETAKFGAAAAAVVLTGGDPLHPSDAAALAAMALQAFSEPRGHVHNGPRMPLGASPTGNHPLPSRPAQSSSAQGPAVLGGGSSLGISFAGRGRGTGCPPAGSMSGASEADAMIREGSQPDSPLSQASTIWENPQVPGSYVVRDLHRPKWSGRQRSGGGEGGGADGEEEDSGAGRAGEVAPDVRTQWWALTGRFHEADNDQMRHELFPYELCEDRRRGGWWWWRWWRPVRRDDVML